MDDLIKKLKASNIGKILTDVKLSNYTTYKVGGIAKVIIYPSNIDKLIELIKILKSQNIKYMVLGYGSNVLFSDNVYDGVIIKLDEFNNI